MANPALCLVALNFLTACTAVESPSIALAAAPALPAPQRLIGSTPAVLDAEFGQPTLLRIDGTAQVWLYKTASCGLNLLLYPDANGVSRVASATTADGNAAIGDCPASLQQSHIDAVSALPADGSLSAALEPPASS